MKIKRKPGAGILKPENRRLIILAAAVTVVIWIWYMYTGSYIDRVSPMIDAGDYDAALDQLRAAESMLLRKGEVYDAYAAVYLLKNNGEKAEDYLEKAADTGVRRSGFDAVRVLEKLVRSGRYDLSLLYAEYLAERGRNDEAVRYYKLCTYNGLNRLDEAAELADELKGGGYDDLLRIQERILDEKLSSGRDTFILDRYDSPLAHRLLETGAYRASTETFRPFLNGETSIINQLSRRELNNKLNLTLDLRLQKKAHRILGEYAGSVVVLDAEKGDVLCALTHPGDSDAKPPNGAFYKQYSPASTMKLLVWHAAMRNSYDLKKFLPYRCTGAEKLGGEILYCWKKHGVIRDLGRAAAESCNTVFGDLAVKMGQSALDGELRVFRFGNDIGSNYFTFHSGRFDNVELDDYGLARRAIGHDNVTVTPIHLALIAQSIAGDGVMIRPRFLLYGRNILGEAYLENKPSPLFRVGDEINMKTIRRGMLRAVEEGTARNAAVGDIEFGVKTGTARNENGNLNSLILGFAPYRKPAVAFAVVAEDAGTARDEVSRMIGELVEAMKELGYL